MHSCWSAFFSKLRRFFNKCFSSTIFNTNDIFVFQPHLKLLSHYPPYITAYLLHSRNGLPEYSYHDLHPHVQHIPRTLSLTSRNNLFAGNLVSVFLPIYLVYTLSSKIIFFYSSLWSGWARWRFTTDLYSLFWNRRKYESFPLAEIRLPVQK